MEDAPCPQIPKEQFSESIEIKQETNNYKLNIDVFNENITLNIIEEKEFMEEYETKLTLDNIRQIHKTFSVLESLTEFIELIKDSINNKKLSIIKIDETKLAIELTTQYLIKTIKIKIDLIKKEINFELIAKKLFEKISVLNENYKSLETNYNNILEENRNIKEENARIKERLEVLENKINISKNEINEQNNNNNAKNEICIDSLIMAKEESNMILSAVKQKMNKEIKAFNKLYQATKDGGQTSNFHQKCDNIENTLILYKSVKNRRFGAFASKKWKSEGQAESDENCFLFSLDKKKIFLPKNKNYYKLSFSTYEGPSFYLKGIYDTHCIVVEQNCFNMHSLKTYEQKFNDVFENDENALSEDGKSLGTYAQEIEVFQIIF